MRWTAKWYLLSLLWLFSPSNQSGIFIIIGIYDVKMRLLVVLRSRTLKTSPKSAAERWTSCVYDNNQLWTKGTSTRITMLVVDKIDVQQINELYVVIISTVRVNPCDWSLERWPTILKTTESFKFSNSRNRMFWIFASIYI